MTEQDAAVLWHAIDTLKSRLDDAESRLEELEGESSDVQARERRKYSLNRRYGGT